jgi:hypothetical protein
MLQQRHAFTADPFGDINSCNIRDINTRPQRETDRESERGRYVKKRRWIETDRE